MPSVSVEEIRGIVASVESDAKEVGLLQPYHKLVFNPGSVTNKIAPEVLVYVKVETGMSRDFSSDVDFLPSFGWNVTKCDVYVQLHTTLKVLELLIRKQNK